MGWCWCVESIQSFEKRPWKSQTCVQRENKQNQTTLTLHILHMEAYISQNSLFRRPYEFLFRPKQFIWQRPAFTYGHHSFACSNMVHELVITCYSYAYIVEFVVLDILLWKGFFLLPPPPLYIYLISPKNEYKCHCWLNRTRPIKLTYIFITRSRFFSERYPSLKHSWKTSAHFSQYCVGFPSTQFWSECLLYVDVILKATVLGFSVSNIPNGGRFHLLLFLYALAGVQYSGWLRKELWNIQRAVW